MSIGPETTISRNRDILHARVGTDEAVMMSIEAGHYYGLNAVGARIWELLGTPQTVERLCERIRAEFDVDKQTCDAAILKFAEELIDNGIVHASGT